MKFRIIAVVIVIAIFGGLYLAAQLLKEGSAPSGGRPDSNDIRNLKIN